MPAFDLERLRSLDRAHHLHPFTDHRAMHGAGTHVIRSAKGCTVVDEQGRPVFVVAVRDVVELLVKSFPREILNLREFDAPKIRQTREGA